MLTVLHFGTLAGFTGLLAVAAFEDFRRFTIPNWLNLSLCALWPGYVVAGGFSPIGALYALGCGLAVFLVGALLFARGYIGGGDVKLLAVVALWAGPAAAPALLIMTGLLGGVLALILISPIGALLFAGARAQLGSAPPGDSLPTTPVPYGIAIAAAALIVVLTPQFT